MRERILAASIDSLRRDGLKFSVDTLADNLKISKKTVYKYFPDKQALALALYERYYADAKKQARKCLESGGEAVCSELLYLYFDSKTMIRHEIFNKYALNETIYSYASGQNDSLWEMLSASFDKGLSVVDRKVLGFVVDGSFEKLCAARQTPDAVIERLAKWLW